jgi:hypothetical protein
MRKFRCLALALQVALAGTCAASETVRHLAFEWPNPTTATPCDLYDPQYPQQRQTRFAGTVERQEIGVACLVQIPRRRFDALYRFCAVSYEDSETREQFACWVAYSPRDVTFLYSYSREEIAAPKCAFVCSGK